MFRDVPDLADATKRSTVYLETLLFLHGNQVSRLYVKDQKMSFMFVLFVL